MTRRYREHELTVKTNSKLFPQMDLRTIGPSLEFHTIEDTAGAAGTSPDPSTELLSHEDPGESFHLERTVSASGRTLGIGWNGLELVPRPPSEAGRSNSF
jgi:hypothetical protein